MVAIQQDKRELNSIKNIVDRGMCTNVEIDLEQVLHDRTRLEKELRQEKSSLNKENLRKAIKWLSLIHDKASKEHGLLEYCWSYAEGKGLRSYPIEVRDIEEYGIHFIDYIKADIQKNKIMRIDYTTLANLIAFEMMHRDLGYSAKDIELILKDIGIISINNPSVLLKEIHKEHINSYMLSKITKANSSPYILLGYRKMTDYFNIGEYSINSYKDAVESSCKHAILLILERTLEKLIKEGIEYSICAVTNTEIELIFNVKKDVDISIAESAVLRIFGRRFEVRPKIQIY